MRILAIDQSLNNSGIAILDGKEIVHIASIKSGKLRDMERLAHIESEFKNLIALYNPEKVIIENYAFGARGRAVFNLGELGGLIRMILYHSKTPYEEISPTTVKKKMTGSGKADKQAMIDAVNKYFNISISDDNQADALALALIGQKLI